MAEKNDGNIQVENETVEPYRGIMIFRSLRQGEIVAGSTRTPVTPQTFYTIVSKEQMPGAFEKSGESERALTGIDVEAVRALIDRFAPGTGLVQSGTPAA